ncbi:MAG: amidohydrolase family protein [Nocardioides sp.]|nr:amidohydrolase family protein [Nocardioides sp.]
MDLEVSGRVPRVGGSFDAVTILISGELITSVSPLVGPAPSELLLPGLVDIHNHGGGGASFTTGSADEIETAARHHHAAGTTTLLGSAVTDSPDRLLAVTSALASACDSGLLAGIHVEGPFIAESCRGAHDPALLRLPDVALTRELIAAARGHLRVVTLAPELPGAGEVAAEFDAAGVIAAAGHTAAPAADLRAFLSRSDGHRGLVTHLFNGMPPTHHRDPGPVLGALGAAAAGSAFVELIADGVHLDDETVRAVIDLVPDAFVLVTDAMAAAGMPDGDYRLGPLDVEVRAGVARLAGGGSIAGGTSRLLDQVRRHASAGRDLGLLVEAASARPASVVGLDGVGRLAPGNRADLVVTDETLRPLRVMRSGAWL